MADSSPGDTLPFEIKRGQKDFTVRIKLQTLPLNHK
jgi:hypothetical protein